MNFPFTFWQAFSSASIQGSILTLNTLEAIASAMPHSEPTPPKIINERRMIPILLLNIFNMNPMNRENHFFLYEPNIRM